MTLLPAQNNQSPDDLLTYAQAAEICGWKTVQPIRKAVKRKQLRIVEFSRKSRRIRRSDLEAFIQLRTTRILQVSKKLGPLLAFVALLLTDLFDYLQ